MKKLVLSLLFVFLFAIPASAEEFKGEQEFSGVFGGHLAPISLPIAGIRYRRTVTKDWALQLGIESGQTTVDPTTSGLSYDVTASISRIHGSLVTTGMLYGGFGMTAIGITVGSYNTSAQAAEALVGMRIPTGNGSYGGEFRLGLIGPSTVTLAGGFKF